MTEHNFRHINTSMKSLRLIALTGTLCVVLYSCLYNDIVVNREEHQLTLRWVKAYPDETKEKVMTGLLWQLSFLGAALPKNAEFITWENDHQLTLNIVRAGFDGNALNAWRKILQVIKESDEYKTMQGIDIGRFVMLTLNSPHHYYAITGAQKSYNKFRAAFDFEDLKGGIVESGVAYGHRVIEIAAADRVDEVAFVALEGAGSIVDNTFSEQEIEVLDVMPNGQLRFAMYNLDGELKVSADPLLTPAGKPAKCLWCHEIRVQRPFYNETDVTGYYTTEQFTKKTEDFMVMINNYRKTLDSQIDFSKTQDHVFSELLYISFMQPSAERLAAEWNISVDEVRVLLAGRPTHEHEEFPFLGSELYNRSDVDDRAPYPVIQVPADAREASFYEPDFFND